jgi:hypothetical protein
VHHAIVMGGEERSPGLCGPLRRAASGSRWRRGLAPPVLAAGAPGDREERAAATTAHSRLVRIPDGLVHAVAAMPRHARPHRDTKHKLARTATACTSTMLQLLAGTSSHPASPAPQRGGHICIYRRMPLLRLAHVIALVVVIGVAQDACL